MPRIISFSINEVFLEDEFIETKELLKQTNAKREWLTELTRLSRNGSKPALEPDLVIGQKYFYKQKNAELFAIYSALKNEFNCKLGPKVFEVIKTKFGERQT